MTNTEVFLLANSVLAEGHYDEFITFCTEDINGRTLEKRFQR